MALLEFKNCTFNPTGTAGTANYPGFKNPSGNGDISIAHANVMTSIASTAALTLVYMDTTGATVQGTLATWAGTTYAGTPLAATLASTVRVPDAKWVALNVGAGALQGEISVEVAYVKGA